MADQILQKGRCAFTAACPYPGPHVRVPGTNHFVCHMHAREMAVPSAPGCFATQFSATEFRPPRGRRRNLWLEGARG